MILPLSTDDGVWEGWRVMSALAEATDRIELGALVLCTAFRDPMERQAVLRIVRDLPSMVFAFSRWLTTDRF